MRAIRYIVVHCSGGPASQTPKQIIAYWRLPKAKGGCGWKNNGYHILVDGSGTRHNLTPFEQVCNGVSGFNANSLHVCYTGGVEGGKIKDTRTQNQKDELIAVLKELKKQFPQAVICGHRDFSPDLNKNGFIEKHEWIKGCPSFDAIKEYENI